MLRDGERSSMDARARSFKHGCRSAFLLLGYGLLAVFLCALGTSPALAQTYTYDGNGRLVAATVADGSGSQYVYDNMGNLQQVLDVAAGQLRIFAFAPNHGAPGLSVTISGQGFSTTASANSISFNGAAATVLSATATTLVTQVPAGATTGPISVTVGSNTATSIDSFIVDGSGLPPVITSVTPSIVAAGTAVTVLGQHLAPVAGQTNVTLNAQPVATTSIADGSIVFAAPASSGSGRVVVQTAFGTATSATDLVVVPSSIGAANVAVVARLPIGGAQALSVPSAKYGALLFDAGDTRVNAWLTLQLNALSTATTLSYSVYDTNNQLLVSGTMSTSSPTLHLPKLRKAGTYSVYVKGSGSGGAASAANLTMGLEAAVPLTVDDPNVTVVATTINSQSKRLLFKAVPGLVLQVPAVATTPQGQNVAVSVNDASGTQVVTATKSVATTLNMPALKADADYLVTVGPTSSTTENASFQLTRQPGGELVIDGPSLSTTAGPGVNAYYTFSAASGDNLELALNGIKNSAGSYTSSNTRVYDPKGNLVASNITCEQVNPASSCRLGLSNLSGGRYSVIVSPDSSSTMSYQITLTRDLVANLAQGQAQSVSLTRPGQSIRLGFAGTAGQTYTLSITNPVTTPTGGNVTVTVLKPDGTNVTTAGLKQSGVINVPNVAATGNYTVLIQPDYGLPATAQVLLSAGATATLTPDGPTQALSTFAGQNAYYFFTASAGDNLEFALSNVTVSGCTSLGVAAYDANGNNVGSGTWYSSNPGKGFRMHLWGLAGGNYQIVVLGCAFTVSGTLTRDVTGTLTLNQALSLDLSQPGRNERLTLNATAGQNLALAVSGLSTTPSGSSVTVTIYQPNGSQWQSSTVTSTQTINLRNLPVTGTYTVVLGQDYGLPASLQLTLLPPLGGAIVADGDTKTLGGNYGQSVYYTFTAAAGENLELGLSGLSMSVTGSSITVNVYNASGGSVASTTLATSSTTGTARASLWNLAAGSYVVVIGSTSGKDSFNCTTTLSHDVTASLVAGVAQPVSVTRIGQAARLTFSGTAGQSKVLTIGSYVTAPTGQNLSVYVNRPDGLSWQNTTPSGGPNGGTVSLQNLPQTGTYTVILAPYYGVTATMNVTVQ